MYGVGSQCVKLMQIFPRVEILAQFDSSAEAESLARAD
jgi:hypothetical protein